MIPKSVLDAAKAYLCWDVLPDLTIQLVAISKASGFYYPPSSQSHTVVLFYSADTMDFAELLFLLFHEMGHVRQWQSLRGPEFNRMLNKAKGLQRVDFERQAWHLGRSCFHDFIANQELSESLLNDFDRYSSLCLKSYKE